MPSQPDNASSSDWQADKLEVAYNARATVSAAEFERTIDTYRQKTLAARESHGRALDIVYDRQSGQRLDLYGTDVDAAPRPVVVFVHGGYWRALGKLDSGFMAPALAYIGCATAVPDYTLAPEASLGEIVRQMRAALAWVWHNAHEHGIDRRRILVCGSSAGGHLVGMLLARGWTKAFDLPEDVIAAAMPISGLFDLDPISRTFPQEWLALTSSDVEALSPIRNLPSRRCPMVVALAENEASGFHKQSRTFFETWQMGQGDTQFMSVPKSHHFDVVLQLANHESELFGSIKRLIELG